MNYKKLIIIVSSVVVILLIITGLYFFVLKGKDVSIPSIINGGETEKQPEYKIIINDNRPLDTDQDGIPDEEEIKLGTSITEFDSDFDGIQDYHEINIWGTDPLNPDTDGDGFPDGLEIVTGYNPLGEGKLNL